MSGVHRAIHVRTGPRASAEASERCLAQHQVEVATFDGACAAVRDLRADTLATLVRRLDEQLSHFALGPAPPADPRRPRAAIPQPPLAQNPYGT